jgi:chromosomal replication initiator protein
LIADIQPPDLETRIAILKKKSELNNVMLPEDVMMYIASNIKSNIRELEGALVRLGAWSSLTGSRIDLDFAKQTLKMIFSDKPQNLSIEMIQDRVSNFYNVKISDLKSHRRTKNLAYPRQIAMYLCKKHLSSSFPEIGEKFGGKDHTTVMHAYRKIERLVKEEPKLVGDIESIERSLK